MGGWWSFMMEGCHLWCGMVICVWWVVDCSGGWSFVGGGWSFVSGGWSFMVGIIICGWGVAMVSSMGGHSWSSVWECHCLCMGCGH